MTCLGVVVGVVGCVVVVERRCILVADRLSLHSGQRILVIAPVPPGSLEHGFPSWWPMCLQDRVHLIWKEVVLSLLGFDCPTVLLSRGLSGGSDWKVAGIVGVVV